MARANVDVNETRSRAQEAMYELLLAKIRRDAYPSPTVMTIVEEHLTAEQLPDYITMLMEKIEGDEYPSMDIIGRIIKLTR